jgi:hypothetical protein
LYAELQILVKIPKCNNLQKEFFKRRSFQRPFFMRKKSLAAVAHSAEIGRSSLTPIVDNF